MKVQRYTSGTVAGFGTLLICALPNYVGPWLAWLVLSPEGSIPVYLGEAWKLHWRSHPDWSKLLGAANLSSLRSCRDRGNWVDWACDILL